MKPIKLLLSLCLLLSTFFTNIQAIVDIELSLSIDNLELVPLEFRTLTMTVSNQGDETATNITANMDVPYAGFLTTIFSVLNASQGSFSTVNDTWNIGTLGAGETATLVLYFQLQEDNEPLQIFAQVATTLETDVDSTPANNTTGIPVEDDEAGLILTNEDIENGNNNDNDNNDNDNDNDGNNNDDDNGGIFNPNDGIVGDPQVLLRAPINPVTGDFKVEVYFSEPVEGLSIEDFVLENCTILALYDDDVVTNQYYSLDVRPTAATPISVQLPANVVSDMDEGNDNIASNLLDINFDFENNFVDLSLELVTNTEEVSLFDSVTYILTIANEGAINATNVVVRFSYDAQNPDNPFIFLSQNVSVGHYDGWNGFWYVPTLAPGEVKTMDLTLLARTEATVNTFIQILDAQQYDNDSFVNNNTTNIPSEDDEAVVTVALVDNVATFQMNDEISASSYVSVMLYPNPVVDYLMLDYKANQDTEVAVSIYNTLGALVEYENWDLYKGNNHNQLNTASLNAGLYLLTISDKDGNILTQQQFVK